MSGSSIRFTAQNAQWSQANHTATWLQEMNFLSESRSWTLARIFFQYRGCITLCRISSVSWQVLVATTLESAHNLKKKKVWKKKEKPILILDFKLPPFFYPFLCSGKIILQWFTCCEWETRFFNCTPWGTSSTEQYKMCAKKGSRAKQLCDILVTAFLAVGPFRSIMDFVYYQSPGLYYHSLLDPLFCY